MIIYVKVQELRVKRIVVNIITKMVVNRTTKKVRSEDIIFSR